MKKVIVMQFLEEGRRTCLKVLTALGISPDEVQTFSNIHGVEEAIGTDERQLFLASSFHGIQFQFPAFVQLLRNKNPQLVCVGYCYEELIGPFEGTILRGLEFKNIGLISVIRDFQSGTLKRSSVRYDGRQFSYADHEGWVEPVLR